MRKARFTETQIIGILKEADAGSAAASAPVTLAPVVDYAAVQRKIEEERKLLRQKAALEEERQQLAMAKRPPAPTVKEIRRDGRFIAYDDGTVLDTSTHLMWAAKDNGANITWDAAYYCKNYRAGNYTDWRMPSKYELQQQYQSGVQKMSHDLVRVTDDWVWASETKGFSEAAHVNFDSGNWLWGTKAHPGHIRALPVRSGK